MIFRVLAHLFGDNHLGVGESFVGSGAIAGLINVRRSGVRALANMRRATAEKLFATRSIISIGK